MDDKLLSAIDNSPLSDEDKNHWKELLPKMNEEQKSRFLETLNTKTEVKNAVDLIHKALQIIEEAESEVEEENTGNAQNQQTQKQEEVLKELDNNKHIDTTNEPISTKELDVQKTETEAKLSALRDQLKSISHEVHGSPPPSLQ